jgi:hypothetical protein
MIMADGLTWVSTAICNPDDRQVVYARVKNGQPKKVMFHAKPAPRWEGASIVYQYGYFAEWAALT